VIIPGLRSTDVRLTCTVRSTRGDRQVILLPPEAILQSVTTAAKEIPIRQTGRQTVIPLTPGTREIALAWRAPTGITTWFSAPSVDLGAASVNSSIEIKPGQRWIWYLQGPQIGPAILFYSELFIIIIAAILLGLSAWTPLKIRHWLLLGLGLSQSGLMVGAVIVCWFLALSLRAKYGLQLGPRVFNLTQVLLVGLTLLAMAGLSHAVQHGLLGHPDMLIAGNQSTSLLLRWYQDRVPGVLPQPAVFSVPLFAYRLSMLAWALWLAISLLKWLKWGWACFRTQRLWQKQAFFTLRTKGRDAQKPSKTADPS
jgi:hypothetical protein